MEQKTYSIKTIFEQKSFLLSKKILVQGWVRAFRNNRFILISDGTSLQNLQIIIHKVKIKNFFIIIKEISISTSVKVIGIIVKSKGESQEIELIAEKIEILGKSLPQEIQETILQPKNHSLEKLREQAHLRFRTNLFGAIIRIRHYLSFAIHEYFHQRGFFYIHTPIITSIDAEGSGEMFRVTTLDLNMLSKNNQGQIDNKQDFFGRETYLTVSGQLEGETAALALSKIYTFGPTFRAENSNTSRHLAEFWMIEPEIAFYDLIDNMNLAEDFLKYLINYIIKNCKEDIDYLNNKYSLQQKKNNCTINLLERLYFILNNDFIKISYTEAIKILELSEFNKKKQFLHPIFWGNDLKSEHERYLVEEYFKSPVILFDYPKDVKAFYMRLNDDQKTVRAMDILFPYIGEIIGGSQREERYDILVNRMNQLNLNTKTFWWYLDTRRFGSVIHSGFGLGFERLIQFITGMSNIRDVIPFPRTPNHAEF